MLDSVDMTNEQFWTLLDNDPIRLVDVGARWGVSEKFIPFSSYLSVVAFEPDDDEAKAMSSDAEFVSKFAKYVVEPVGLYSHECEKELNLLRRANNSSLYPVDPEKYLRYSLKGFELDKLVKLKLTTLDNYCEKKEYYPDILKIDTQGAELEILKGAVGSLNQVKGVVAEASFYSPYIGACTFTELNQFLENQGFSLYGLVDVQHRGTKRIDKSTIMGAERIMQADAVYLRDLEYVRRNDFAVRDIFTLITFAVAYGYFDYALELVELDRIPDRHRYLMRSFIMGVATGSMIDKKSIQIKLNKILHALEYDQNIATILLGKLGDELKDINTYHEFGESV